MFYYSLTITVIHFYCQLIDVPKMTEAQKAESGYYFLDCPNYTKNYILI
jgi:hypothetical protein